MTSAFEEEKPFQRKPIWIAAFMILPLLLAFMAPQAANAGGGEVAIEMISIQAERQLVDVDGDGQLDVFSADFVVKADGTASGTLYNNFNFLVNVDAGSVKLEPNGDIIVTVQGVDEHEIGHTLGFRYEHTASRSGEFDGDGEICLEDFVVWTATTTTGHVNSFGTIVQLSIR
jgi:hypothetical protein